MRNRQHHHGVELGFYKFCHTNLSPVQPQAGSEFGLKKIPGSGFSDSGSETGDNGPNFVT